MICEISYDLIEPGKDYEDIIKTIKSMGSWCHVLKSTWLVDTALTIDQINKLIETHTDKTDAYWITDLTSTTYWVKASAEVRNWIKEHVG